MTIHRHLVKAVARVTALALAAAVGVAAAGGFDAYPDPGIVEATDLIGPAVAGYALLGQAAAPTPTLLTEGLGELQGSTVGPDGALYVTAPLDGEIWRVDPDTGAATLFASGLPARDPDPFHVGSGVVDVAFEGDTAYALVTSVDVEYGAEDYVKGIYRIDGPDSHTVIADIGRWSEANLPEAEYFIDSGFQFAIEAFRGGFLVTDGHHNRVLWVDHDGAITELIAFDNIVPTGMSIVGESIYVAQAGPIPHEPENGKVVVFDYGSSTATQVAAGARLVLDVEFGPGDTILALSQGDWEGEFDGAPALPDTGSLVRADGDGGFQVLAAGLDRPTSLEVVDDTAYVVTIDGEVWTIAGVSGALAGQ